MNRMMNEPETALLRSNIDKEDIIGELSSKIK